MDWAPAFLELARCEAKSIPKLSHNVIFQFHSGWVQSGEQELGLLLPHITKGGYKSLPAVSLPLGEFHSAVDHGLPSQCQTCKNRKFSVKCANAYGTQIHSTLISKFCWSSTRRERGASRKSPLPPSHIYQHF